MKRRVKKQFENHTQLCFFFLKVGSLFFVFDTIIDIAVFYGSIQEKKSRIGQFIFDIA